MTPTTSMKYWIFLQHVLGQGSRKLLSLLVEYQSAQAAYEAGPEDWERLKLFTPAELKRFHSITIQQCQDIVEYCWRHNYDILTPNDKRYPRNLAHLQDPPAVLYIKGEFPPIDDHVVLAMVGTRQCSANGKKIARDLSQRLTASGALIVSGGAIGIDSSAHIGAIRAGGKTIAVLGCGLDYPYLMANEELREDIAAHGALVSEYPPKAPVAKFNFPMRNRLISGLALGTIIVEATKSSGSLITMEHALQQGRDIFVVPGSISDPLYAGSNRLIRDGAKAILSPMDVLEEYIGNYPHRLNLAGCEISVEDEEDALELAKPMEKPEALRQKAARIVKKSRTRRKKAEAKSTDDIPNEILETLKLNYPLLSENAKTLFAAFIDSKTDNFDVAMHRCDLCPADAIAAITELEIFGFLEAVPGGRYNVKYFQEETHV